MLEIIKYNVSVLKVMNLDKIILQKKPLLDATLRPLPLERPLDNVDLNINVLISTPEERPPRLKGHFSDAKGVASQVGFPL